MIWVGLWWLVECVCVWVCGGCLCIDVLIMVRVCVCMSMCECVDGEGGVVGRASVD